jgi:hypothetical protein
VLLLFRKDQQKQAGTASLSRSMLDVGSFIGGSLWSQVTI